MQVDLHNSHNMVVRVFCEIQIEYFIMVGIAKLEWFA